MAEHKQDQPQIASLRHLVHPNLSDELRVSISFNVVLRWRDTYLP